MKSYGRRALIVASLLLAISYTAFADDGVIHTERTNPPPPPITNGVGQAELAEGERPAGLSAQDALTETALSVLQNLLALL